MKQTLHAAGFKSGQFFLLPGGLFIAVLFIGIMGLAVSSSVVNASTSPKWLLTFEQKCESGSMVDCQNAAHTFAQGKFKKKSTDVNMKKANYYIARILEMGKQGCADQAKLGDCYLLGLMYFEGMAINRDIIKGMDIINKVCKAGYEPSCTWLHNRGVR